MFYRFLDIQMKTWSIWYTPWLFINKDCTSEWFREGENLIWQMLLCKIEPGENEHRVYSVERSALAHANENASVITKDSLTEIIFCTNNYKVYVSSWWTVVCLKSTYPKSCFVMLPEVEVCPDREVQGEALLWIQSLKSLSVPPVAADNKIRPYGLDTSWRKYNKKAISASNQKLAFNQNTWLLKINFRSEFLIGLSITLLFLHITLNFLVTVATLPNFFILKWTTSFQTLLNLSAFLTGWFHDPSKHLKTHTALT